MNTTRDRLDEAIDHVAARMTRVEDNDAFATEIINALPERTVWSGWLFQSWAPRLAMLAIVVAAGMVWANRKPDAVKTVELLAISQPAPAPIQLVAAAQAAEPLRAQPVERMEPVERLEPAPATDFDRSLPAIAAMRVLVFDSLAPESLPEDAPLTLKPLAIESLPLTDDSFSPRR